MLFNKEFSTSIVTERNPRNTLTIVLCGSLIVYATVAVLFLQIISPSILIRDDLTIAILQGALVYVFLFLIFLLPASYVYWRYRIEVKVLGPDPAAAEPGDEIHLTIAIGFPRKINPKGAILEAFLKNLNIATQKVDTSPTTLLVKIPEITVGYHKITVRVSQEGYFAGSSSYELLIAQGDQPIVSSEGL